MLIYEQDKKLKINILGNNTSTEDVVIGKDDTTGKTQILVSGTPAGGLPEGGEPGNVLTKTEDGAEWKEAGSGLPEGGNDGDVLTRVVTEDETKAEWKAPASGGCDLYEHTTALFTRAVGSPLGMCVSYISSNPEPLTADNFIQEIAKMFAPSNAVEVEMGGERGKVAKFMLNGYAAWDYSSLDEVITSMLNKFPLKYISVYYMEPLNAEGEGFYYIGACGESNGEIVDERLIPFDVFEGKTEVADMVRKL